MNTLAAAASHHPRQNPALLPGSMLRYRPLWQQLADSLPAGAVLVILPPAASPQRRGLESTALQIQASGHRVTTWEAAALQDQPAIQGYLPF